MGYIFNEAIGMGSFNDLGISWWYRNKLRNKIKKKKLERERGGLRLKNVSLLLIFKQHRSSIKALSFFIWLLITWTRNSFLLVSTKMATSLVISIMSLLFRWREKPCTKHWALLNTRLHNLSPMPQKPSLSLFCFSSFKL